VSNNGSRVNPAALRLTAMRFLDTGIGRLVRFGVVGGASGLVQLVMLQIFKSAGLSAVPAYALGLIVSLQFNFGLNTVLVWGDRPVGVDRWRALF
jgi:putative flippase GtrA